jgi:hypothetical protein
MISASSEDGHGPSVRNAGRLNRWESLIVPPSSRSADCDEDLPLSDASGNHWFGLLEFDLSKTSGFWDVRHTIVVLIIQCAIEIDEHKGVPRILTDAGGPVQG